MIKYYCSEVIDIMSNINNIILSSIMPGNFGNDCIGNGEHYDSQGKQIILCDECDFQLCCSEVTNCLDCRIKNCPRKHRCTD